MAITSTTSKKTKKKDPVGGQLYNKGIGALYQSSNLGSGIMSKDTRLTDKNNKLVSGGGSKLTSTEKRAKIDAFWKANPNFKGSVSIDSFGNITPNPVGFEAQQGAKVEGTKEALGLQSDRQILAERQRQASIQEQLAGAEAGLPSMEELIQNTEASPLDLNKAANIGTLEAAPTLTGLLGGAALAAGGVGLTVGTGGAGAIAGVPLAVAGLGAMGLAVKQWYSGTKSALKTQQSSNLGKGQDQLAASKSNLKLLVGLAHTDPENSDEYISMFYTELGRIDQAHAQTWKDNQDNINKYLGGGDQELNKFVIFDNQLRQIYIAKFNEALLNPDPSKALAIAQSLENLEVD